MEIHAVHSLDTRANLCCVILSFCIKCQLKGTTAPGRQPGRSTGTQEIHRWTIYCLFSHSVPFQSSFCLGKQKTRDSIYWSNNQSIVPSVHSTFSHLFSTSKRTTFQERRAALRFRGGCLLHTGIHTQPAPLFPSCSSPDSMSHILMSCKFAPLDNLRTDRHNHVHF